jgi:hypothetical protein
MFSSAMLRRRNATIASRPSNVYAPPPYDAVASCVKHRATPSQSFVSRQRT